MPFRSLLGFLLLFAGTASAKLEVLDIQHSYGQLGPTRKYAEYIRGDEVYLRFQIAGVKTDVDGRTNGEIKFSVLNPKSEEIVKQVVALRAVLALGGDRFPSYVSLALNEGIPVGTYTVVVEVTDLISRETASFRRECTLKETEFALGALRFYQDKDATVPAPVGGVVSQTLYLRFHAMGFDRSKDEIDVVMTLEALDEEGKSLTKKPIKAVLHKEGAEEVKLIQKIKFSGEMTLHRPGTFRLRLTVTDTLAKKTVTFESPLRVVAP